MDKKQFKRAIKHWFGRMALKTVYFLVGFLPIEFIYPLGNWIGGIAYYLAARHRKLALQSLEIALGKELTPSQMRGLAKESFRNMAKGSLELMAYLYEVSEKPSRTASETSDYGDSKKITQILSTKINHCNLNLISVIKRFLYSFRLFQKSLYNGDMNPVRNFVRNFVFPFNIGISNGMKDKIAIEGKRNLDAVLSKGNGAIGLTAHFGNFPLLGARLAQEGYKVNYVLRRMRDEKLEGLFQRKRDQLRLGSIMSQPRRECIEACLDRLSKNQLLLLAMDQNFGNGGVFVDFFGKEAATPTGPVVFALRTGADILPIFIVRQKDETHKIFINPPIPLEIKTDHKQTVIFNTAKLTKIIESYVRQYPSQWGWINRRWKDRSYRASQKCRP